MTDPAKPLPPIAAGVEWDSPNGRRIVRGQLEDGRWIVATEGEPFADLMPSAEYVETIRRVDLANLAYRAKQDSEQIEREAREAAEKAAREDLDGFDAGMSPMRRARVLEALTTQISIGGIIASRRDHIRRLVAEGRRVRDWMSHGRCLVSPDGSFHTQRDLTKAALDYAEYLSAHLY